MGVVTKDEDAKIKEILGNQASVRSLLYRAACFISDRILGISGNVHDSCKALRSWQRCRFVTVLAALPTTVSLQVIGPSLDFGELCVW